MRPLHFWLTSLLVALVFAGAAAAVFPYEPLGLATAGERQRAWLLTLWTAGVMAVCFGASGLLSNMAPLGFRDVADAGSVQAAIEARREAHERQGQHSTAFYNFAGWTAVTGFWLIAVYFVGWIAGRG